MPRHPLLEALDHVQKGARSLHILDVLQHVRFGTDQLVGLSQIGCAAVADQLARHPSGQRVARNARKGVRAAALQGDFEMGQIVLAPLLARHFRGPSGYLPLALCQTRLKGAVQAHKAVPDVIEGIAVRHHVLPQYFVGHGFATIVHRQHSADVGMGDKAGQRAQ